MKKRSKSFSTTLGFETLENRRLLAADFASSLAPAVDVVEPVQVQVATEQCLCAVEDGAFDLGGEESPDPADIDSVPTDFAPEISDTIDASEATESLGN